MLLPFMSIHFFPLGTMTIRTLLSDVDVEFGTSVKVVVVVVVRAKYSAHVSVDMNAWACT